MHTILLGEIYCLSNVRGKQNFHKSYHFGHMNFDYYSLENSSFRQNLTSMIFATLSYSLAVNGWANYATELKKIYFIVWFCIWFSKIKMLRTALLRQNVEQIELGRIFCRINCNCQSNHRECRIFGFVPDFCLLFFRNFSSELPNSNRRNLIFLPKIAAPSASKRPLHKDIRKSHSKGPKLDVKGEEEKAKSRGAEQNAECLLSDWKGYPHFVFVMQILKSRKLMYPLWFEWRLLCTECSRLRNSGFENRIHDLDYWSVLSTNSN